MSVIFFFQLIVLLFSAVIHEVSHGLMADHLGDPTARYSGRLTFNPLKHLDPFGSIILPIGLFLASGGGFLFGWAKPVPYNPYNLKNPERDGALIALAGPLSNLSLAVIFSVIIKLISFISLSPIALSLQSLLSIIVLLNIVLAIFNLVPLPPLDGSKVFFALLPRQADKVKVFLNQYGVFILLIFIFFGFNLILPVVSAIYGFLV